MSALAPCVRCGALHPPRTLRWVDHPTGDLSKVCPSCKEALERGMAWERGAAAPVRMDDAA